MKRSPDQLADDLKNGKLAPVYLLHGQEVHLIDQALEALTNTLLGPEPDQFSFESYSAPETSPGSVSSSLSQMNVFGGDKVVLVKYVHEVKATWLEDLLDVVAAPPNDSRLIFTAGQKIAASTRFFKAVNQSGVVVEFSPMRERDAGQWLRQTASARGRKISSGAALRLIARAGVNTADLTAELEKLDLFLAPGREITERDVLEVAAEKPDYDNFALGEAAAQRDAMQALAILHHLLTNGDVRALGPLLVGMLAQKIRTLLKARDLLDSGQTGQAARVLKLPPFIAKTYLNQAKGFSRTKLAQALVRLHQTDIAIKTGSPIRESLETFLLWLAKPGD